MDTNKPTLGRTVAENILASAVGTSVGYGAGVLSASALLNSNRYTQRLAKMSPAQRRREIQFLKGLAASGGAAAGGLAGLAARQRLRKARKNDTLTRKLAELR